LRDHTSKLQEINAESFKIDTLVKFLCSAAFPESKYEDLITILLKQALENSGNVAVLLDGIDEIIPIHGDKAIVFLSKLMKTKVKRVWITSRPVHRERLENKLSVTAFTLKKLSHESQKEMLCHIWNGKANKTRGLEAYDRLRQENESVYYRNLTGCPLNIIMIASALEGKLESKVKSRLTTDKLNLLYLYDKFVERKIYIEETEKKTEDFTNASLRDDRGMSKKIYLENLEKCSLLVTLPSELNPLSDEEMQTTLQPFVERLEAGKDKICIAMNVTEKRLHFVHRSVAEYFTARWCSKNFESNRRVLEHILFDSSYGILKDMFDRILARGCPLHCAVLNRDIKAVKTLLKGSKVNAVDKRYKVNAKDNGGRTALHLIAAQGPGVSLCKEITKSLLEHGATLNTKDKVLDWTPLEYARKTGNSIVEQLLSG
jgi:hypothetical protein